MHQQQQGAAACSLEVSCINATNLPNVDGFLAGKSDPYCIVCIPGKKNAKFQTPVINNDLNPAWNHTDQIHDYVQGDSLEFQVWDKDTFPKPDQLIGKVTLTPEDFAANPYGMEGELPLEECKVQNATLAIKVLVIPSEEAQQQEYQQQEYQQQQDEAVKLVVEVLNGRELPQRNDGRKVEYYVTCSSPGRPGATFDTPVIDNVNPDWNFVGEIQSVSPMYGLEFSVWDKEPNAADPRGSCIGTVALSGEDFAANPHGLEGEVPINSERTNTPVGTLAIRVHIVPDDAPAAQPMVHTQANTQYVQYQGQVDQYTPYQGQVEHVSQPATVLSGGGITMPAARPSMGQPVSTQPQYSHAQHEYSQPVTYTYPQVQSAPVQAQSAPVYTQPSQHAAAPVYVQPSQPAPIQPQASYSVPVQSHPSVQYTVAPTPVQSRPTVQYQPQPAVQSYQPAAQSYQTLPTQASKPYIPQASYIAPAPNAVAPSYQTAPTSLAAKPTSFPMATPAPVTYAPAQTAQYPSFAAPASFAAPKPSYAAPQTYTQPAPAYSQPAPTHVAPQVQPMTNYRPPQAQYAPPQAQYAPPQAQYAPPQAQYAPPQTQYVNTQPMPSAMSLFDRLDRNHDGRISREEFFKLGLMR